MHAHTPLNRSEWSKKCTEIVLVIVILVASVVFFVVPATILRALELISSFVAVIIALPCALTWGAVVAYFIWKIQARAQARRNIHSMFSQSQTQHSLQSQPASLMMVRQPARPVVPQSQTEPVLVTFNDAVDSQRAASVEEKVETPATTASEEEDVDQYDDDNDERDLLMPKEM